MAAPGFGHGSYVQIGRESVWGTKVAATRRFRVVSSDFQPERAKVPSDALTDTVARKNYFNGPQRVTGKLDLELDYEGQLYLFDGAQGTSTFASDGGTKTGAGPYTWSFLQRALLNSYTIEDIAGPIPTSKGNVATGCKIKSMTISGSGGFDAKPIKLSVDWVGKDWADNQTPTAALTANTPIPVMFHHISTGSFKAGTADSAGTERLRSFEITIPNPLADDRWYGADTMDEPLRNGYAEPTFKWTLEFATKSAIADYLNSTLTSGAPLLTFSLGTKSITFGSFISYIVTPVSRPVNNFGVLLQDFTLTAVDDTNTPSSGIIITTVNSESTIS